MVPLCAARVQDLGPEDVAVFKCDACEYAAEIPPSGLLRRLGLKLRAWLLALARGTRSTRATVSRCRDPKMSI